MNYINKDSVIRSFDKVAQTYDINAGLQQYMACVLFALCKKYTENSTTALDIGTGTGYGVRLLCNSYPQTKVVGIDLSQQMILKSKASCSRFQNAHFACADADKLPFAESTFDLIYSNAFIQWCSDSGSLFKQLRNILKEEGRLFFSTFGPQTLIEIKESWKAVDDHPHTLKFKDAEQMKQELRDNGFEVELCLRALKVMHHEGVRSALRSLKDIGAQNHLMNRLSGLTSPQKLRAMSEMYLDRYGVQGFVPTTYEILLFATSKR